MDEFAHILSTGNIRRVMEWIDAGDINVRAGIAYSHAILTDNDFLYANLREPYLQRFMYLPEPFSKYANRRLMPRFLDDGSGLAMCEFMDRHNMRDPAIYPDVINCFRKCNADWRELLVDGMSVGGVAAIRALRAEDMGSHLFERAVHLPNQPPYSVEEFSKLAEVFVYLFRRGIYPEPKYAALVNGIVRGDPAAFRASAEWWK